MEMRDEDQPPQRIWLNDKALEEHFERVHERYASGSTTSSPDTEALDQNELTKGLRGH